MFQVIKIQKYNKCVFSEYYLQPGFLVVSNEVFNPSGK